MMNRARLGVGIQGVAIAERAFQQALNYARERKQGRGPDGKETEIIHHADVKRMLLSMKAKTAAARSICYMTARMIDIAERSGDEKAQSAAHATASLLTPVAKAFSTDMGIDVASEGVQVHGGMGFIEETGAAQHLRDARITSIYEGTNGIQAIDLVARKLPLEEGETVQRHIVSLRKIVAEVSGSNVPAFGDTASCLEKALSALEEASAFLLEKLGSELETALAGASAYSRLFGITSGAVYVAKGALKQARDGNDSAGGAITLARYYAENHAVEAPGLAKSIITGGSWVSPEAGDALTG
jgi:hypothetical protein